MLGSLACYASYHTLLPLRALSVLRVRPPSPARDLLGRQIAVPDADLTEAGDEIGFEAKGDRLKG